MARPQKENGYTPIANELLEAIYTTPFNTTQLKIILLVLRYTYGFSRKEHSFSLNFIARGTGVSRRYISSELKTLIDRGVITIVSGHTDTEARILKFNKDYDSWVNSRSIVQQVNNNSTGEVIQDTTGEELFHTTGEESFYQDKQSLKQNIKQCGYTNEFIKFWSEYPRKTEKKAAFTKWKTTKRKGAFADNLIAAAINYAEHCKREGTEERYIKHPKTFLGPDEHWREYLQERARPKDMPNFTGASDEKLYGGNK